MILVLNQNNIVMKNRFIAVVCSMALLACESDDVQKENDINDPNTVKGSLSVNITDAPIDQAGVTGAFITVTEIKVDGKTFSGFEGPKTFNLLELQNGNTLNLGKQDVAANTYSTLTLVLDIDKDASGTGPGCYVTKTGGTKEKLELAGKSTASLDLKPSDFIITESGQTEMVIDFDLRKAVNQKDGDFAFVTENELKAALRAENKVKTGTIKGKIDNFATLGSSAVVYAYKKGTFDSSKEISGQGSSEVKFANAVSSAKTDASGNFTLAFLPSEEYEIHVDKPSGSGLGLGLNTLLQTSSSVDLKAIKVAAGAQVNLSLSVTGK